MTNERKHVKSIEGHPRPSDIFKPHLMGVELFEDMDELFREARRQASGEDDDEVTRSWKKFEGQRALAIITPGRLTMFCSCPEPNSMPEELIAQERLMMPPDPPLKMSVISNTFIEALTTDIDKAIPFRGYLIMWAYLGHSVIVFEGHPSAFESGVRDCDVLFVDSGMLPFMPLNWIDLAGRVMNEGARIFVHDRATYALSQINTKPDAAQSKTRAEAHYAELLLRLLMRASRTSIEITSGTVVPDLAELITDPGDREWLIKSFAIEREELDADSVIDRFLQRAGWRWYTPFKTKGVLRSQVTTVKRTGEWLFNLSVRKDSAGRRQLVIER
ncbi:MAG TPA: hypothetical protein VLB46_20605 [Pyrinomonadaceae bacterium]|nr:hypothetical protein [Pyrinomonadaceae bacterium]